MLLVELGQHNDCEIEEKKSKLEQLKTVLEMWVIHNQHYITIFNYKSLYWFIVCIRQTFSV